MESIDTQKFSDAVAEGYALERFEGSEFQREMKIVQKYVKGNQKILDLCCGPGTFLIPLHQMGYHVEGLDFSREMLKQAARRQKNLRLMRTDASSIPREDNTFDVVICMGNSLGSIPGRKNRERILGEACRVLRLEGTFIVATHNRYGLTYHLPKNMCLLLLHHLGVRKHELGDRIFEMSGVKGFNHIYSSGELRADLKNAGFRKIKSELPSFSGYCIYSAVK